MMKWKLYWLHESHRTSSSSAPAVVTAPVSTVNRMSLLIKLVIFAKLLEFLRRESYDVSIYEPEGDGSGERTIQTSEIVISTSHAALPESHTCITWRGLIVGEG